MTYEELEFLQRAENAHKVAEYLAGGVDAHRAALLSGSGAIASQVKYLARAARKLPSYAAAHCIIDAQGFEQCSSEKTARSKFRFINPQVEPAERRQLAIDLTCGLGVDSMAMARLFERVIAVERDPVRAEIAKWNFAKMGIENVELIHLSAEEFIERFRGKEGGQKADLIYIDPSRPENYPPTRRLFVRCRPYAMGLMGKLRDMSERIVIKLSPMFDIAECFRIFGPDISVEAVSLDGECKELLVGMGTHTAGSTICTVLRSGKGVEASISFYRHHDTETDQRQADIPNPQFLYVPDVTFTKTRTLRAYLGGLYNSIPTNSEGYVIAEQRLKDFLGQEFAITACEPYQPGHIKKLLSTAGIKHATIAHHNFPYSTARIMADLGLREGGSQWLFFSLLHGKPTVFFAQPIKKPIQ